MRMYDHKYSYYHVLQFFMLRIRPPQQFLATWPELAPDAECYWVPTTDDILSIVISVTSFVGA